MRRRLALALALVCETVTAQAVPRSTSGPTIAYTLRHELGRTTATIVMRVSGHVRDEVTVAFPSWQPGSYRQRELFRRVRSLTAISDAGETLDLQLRQPGEWSIASARRPAIVVRYEIALFAAGSETPAADGHFVHVFVDRATDRPCPIPEPIRTALAALAPTG